MLLDTCPHCGNKQRLDELACARQDLPWNVTEIPATSYRAWRVLLCRSCHEPTILQLGGLASLDEVMDGRIEVPDDGPLVRSIPLYPRYSFFPGKLPPKVERAYQAALRQRNIDPNDFAVNLRRLLDEICADREAAGSDLNQKIEHLAAKGDIPARLAEAAHGLRLVGNIGAHAGSDVCEEDLPLLIGLCGVILEYVYWLPGRVEAIRRKAKKRGPAR